MSTAPPDAPTIDALLPKAKEALQPLMKKAFGNPDALEVASPSRAATPGGEQDLSSRFVMQAAEGRVVVVLTPAWVSPLAEGILGEEIEPQEPRAGDLMSTAISRGYDAVKEGLDGEASLPAFSFEVVSPGEAPSLAEGPYWHIDFSVEQEGGTLEGAVFFPADGAAETEGMDTNSVELADLGREQISGDGGLGGNFNLLAEVELEVRAELGRRRLPLSDMLQLTSGSVIELEKFVGEPLEIYANGRLIGEGEAVVIGEQFGIRIIKLAAGHKDKGAFL